MVYSDCYLIIIFQKNITLVTYNEVTKQYDYETTCENYGGDVFISPMKYVNSLFYDIRNRRRKENKEYGKS